MSSLKTTLIPTGGAVSLSISASGATTLSRAVSGVSGLGAFTQLYSGPAIQYYLDVGDLLPAPLVATDQYVYQLTDTSGTLTSSPITPACFLNLQIEPLLSILIRLLQAGINNLVPPTGINKAQVIQAMPLGGLQPMPFIVCNLDLKQMSDIPIGQTAEQVDKDGNWTMTGFARYIFRTSILATNSLDRDFYRDAVVGIFLSIIKSVFSPLGLDIRHNYQASSGQVANDTDAKAPGFYYCDVLTTFEGTFNTLITPSYGLMNTITFTGYSETDNVPVISTSVTV